MPITKDENHIPQLKMQIQKLANKKIQVGILGETDLLQIGIANEFGARIPVSPQMRKLFAVKGFPLKATTKFFIIPERSYLRTAFDDAKTPEEIYKVALKLLDNIDNPESVLDAIGIRMSDIIRAKIKSNIKPSNHPFTTLMKGGKNKTLINSGRLDQGITHNVI